jgi:hypothetical protein
MLIINESSVGAFLLTTLYLIYLVITPCTTESMFGPLHCTEYQKTLYTVQQLRGATGAWWASYIATLPDDHHVPWGEFCNAFHAHHLSAGLLRSTLKESWTLSNGTIVYSTT